MLDFSMLVNLMTNAQSLGLNAKRAYAGDSFAIGCHASGVYARELCARRCYASCLHAGGQNLL